MTPGQIKRAARGEAMRMMYEGGATTAEVAAAYGMSQPGAQNALDRAGTKKRRRGHALMDNPLGEQVYRARVAGMKWREIAARYGYTDLRVPHQMAKNAARSRGLPWPPPINA